MIVLYVCVLLLSLSQTMGKDDLELPLCPINIEFFPQELPMHCRMPKNVASNTFKLPDGVDSDKIDKRQIKRKAAPEFAYYQSPSPDKLPPPISFPVPPFPMPGVPLGMPGPSALGMELPIPAPVLGMPGSNPGTSGPMPGMPGPMPGWPGALPMPMPIPMSGGPPHKMPVIVMPFYSQDRRSFTRPPRRPKHKKKPHRHDSIDTDLNSDEFDNDKQKESSEEGWWKAPKKNKNKKKKSHKKYGIYRRFYKHHNMNRQKKKDLLTPILQYVTKEGYVIFEKKISNNEAKGWLGPRDGAIANQEIKANEEARKEYPEKVNYKNIQINEEHDPKIEMEDFDKDNIEDLDTQETTSPNLFKKDGSRESNEINESKITAKPRKKIKVISSRPGP